MTDKCAWTHTETYLKNMAKTTGVFENKSHTKGEKHMAKYTVEFDTNDKQEAALLELLPYWQQYTSKEDNSKPFEHFTIEKLFETIMQIGCLHTIWNKIEEEQFRQGLISTEEWLDNRDRR